MRELYGVMAANGATGEFVVKSGRFTAEAEALFKRRNVRLLDRPKQAKNCIETPPAAAAAVSQTVGSLRHNASSLSPVGPKCAQQMKRRQATNGARAGQDFWGDA